MPGLALAEGNPATRRPGGLPRGGARGEKFLKKNLSPASDGPARPVGHTALSLPLSDSDGGPRARPHSLSISLPRGNAHREPRHGGLSETGASPGASSIRPVAEAAVPWRDRGVRPVRSRRPNVSTWLILPVVICLSQRLSHACLSTSLSKVKPRMAH